MRHLTFFLGGGTLRTGNLKSDERKGKKRIPTEHWENGDEIT
jgi:hypothetical protein